jgi:hypothetical protein
MKTTQAARIAYISCGWATRPTDHPVLVRQSARVVWCTASPRGRELDCLLLHPTAEQVDGLELFLRFLSGKIQRLVTTIRAASPMRTFT